MLEQYYCISLNRSIVRSNSDIFIVIQLIQAIDFKTFETKLFDKKKNYCSIVKIRVTQALT